MIKNPKTVRIAYLDWQRKALPYITKLSILLGVHFENIDTEWFQSSENQWYRKDERDKIFFDAIKPIKMVQTDGNAVPIKSDPKWAGVDQAANATNSSVMFSQSYEASSSVRKLREESKMEGWSLELGLTAKFGYDEANNVEISITTGAHGEYGQRMEDENTATSGSSVAVSVEVPPHTTYIIQQRQDTAEIDVPVTQQIVFDVSFEIIDWKKVKSSYLKDNKRWQPYKSTKSRRLFRVNDIDDLYEILTGNSGDFPNINNNLLEDEQKEQKENRQSLSQRVTKSIRKGRDHNQTFNPDLNECYDWLADESNRSFTVESTITYEDARKGSIRIYNPNNDSIIKEQDE